MIGKRVGFAAVRHAVHQHQMGNRSGNHGRERHEMAIVIDVRGGMVIRQERHNGLAANGRAVIMKRVAHAILATDFYAR